MTERTFQTAVSAFLDVLIGEVNFRAHLGEREQWMGPRSRDIDSCRTAIAALHASWNRSPQDLKYLSDMTEKCLAYYEQGSIDAGDHTTRDIHEFVARMRDCANRP